MIRYFRLTLGAHFRSGRALYLLTVLGVAFGVASVLCIQIINRNALAAFTGSVRAVSGDADLSVMGRTPTFPDSLLATVLAEPGVRAARPLVRAEAALIGHDGRYLDIVGLDFFAATRVPWSGAPADPAQALTQPGWAAVTPELASQLGWRVGDAVEVSRGSRRVGLVIGGLVDFQRVSALASRRLAVMDIAQAQSLLGRRGELDQIDLTLQAGADHEQVAARLAARLGPAMDVLTPAQRGEQAEGLLEAFRLNLTALSLISLFVGGFLIFSSIQAALVRRRAEFGLLRSVGATRGQVLGLILGEVGLLGALGVAFGLPLGYWAARANMDVVSSALTNLYLLDAIERLELPVQLYGLAAAIGLGGALGGALLPALDMSRKDTRALLASSMLHERMQSLAGPLLAAAGCLTGAAALWYWRLGQAWRPSGFVLAVVLLTVIPLATPFAVQHASRRRRVRHFGFALGVKSLGVRLGTTAFAVASLAIAVSMLIGITLMIGSFRQTLSLWIETAVRADIYVTTPSWRGRGTDGGLDSGLVAALAAQPGVRAVDRLRGLPAYAGDRRIRLAGVDMGLPGGERRFPLLQGDVTRAFRAVREHGAVFISEPLARKASLAPGDTLVITGPRGPWRLPVAAVYYDYATEAGAAVVDLATLSAGFGPGPVSSVALYLEPGLDPDRMIDELKARFHAIPLSIRSNQAIRKQALAIFDQTFAVTRILQTMGLVIAACGIALTLLVLARERASELALYRALGASRAQILRLFVGQGTAMGVIGLALGSVGGVALAALLIFVVNRSYFGWTIQVSWPAQAMLQQVATILTAAVLASLYPAIRASRTPATELSREE